MRVVAFTPAALLKSLYTLHSGLQINIKYIHINIQIYICIYTCNVLFYGSFTSAISPSGDGTNAAIDNN